MICDILRLQSEEEFKIVYLVGNLSASHSDPVFHVFAFFITDKVDY